MNDVTVVNTISVVATSINMKTRNKKKICLGGGAPPPPPRDHQYQKNKNVSVWGSNEKKIKKQKRNYYIIFKL